MGTIPTSHRSTTSPYQSSALAAGHIVHRVAATSTTVTHTANKFTGYTGCSVSIDEGDFVTGESGPVSTYLPGEFSYDPTGHALTVTVSLYSEKGNAGTVVTRTLSVTP